MTVSKRLVVAIAVIISLAGCGPRFHRVATVSVVGAHATLSALQDGELLLVCGKPSAPPEGQCVPDAAHRQISTRLEQAFDYDGQVARLVRATPPGAPTSAQVFELVGKIQTLVTSILADLPAGPRTDHLLELLGGTR